MENKNLNKSRFYLLFYISLCFCAFAVNLSCSSPPTDLRAFVPAETLVYLETGNLAATLDALTENKAFESLAKNKPDFSALKNMQLAVAVTGFKTSEQQVTNENAVLDFKPLFVAVADTHVWNWQAVGFTENKLGEFVNETYGGEVALETVDKNGGKSFVWTATDGRKVFAFVERSRIFFGNDETAIEKCLSAARGEIESLAKSGKNFAAPKDALAAGYASSEGIAQIANVAGVQTAIEATDESEARGFIARVFPALVRNSVREIVWTATKTTNGIEDKYIVATAPESASVLRETLVPANAAPTDSMQFLPLEITSATRYDLQNSLIAWRSLLLVAAKQTDEFTGKILAEFSGAALDVYGITDAEIFLSAIDSPILTAQFDAEGENAAAIVAVKDVETLKKSIGEINFKAPPEKRGDADVWKSFDGETAAAFVGNKLITGETESVNKCLEARQNGKNFTKHELYKTFSESKSVVASISKTEDSAEKIVGVLTETKAENQQFATNFFTETNFNEKGFERRTVSPFGLIGSILEQMEK
jgi:hypothetical protein